MLTCVEPMHGTETYGRTFIPFNYGHFAKFRLVSRGTS
jgi:hypothetical protein